jgi:two-component system response regulator FixJ
MTGDPAVFVVDDGQAVRGSLRWLLESLSLKAQTYPSAQDFFSAYNPSTWGVCCSTCACRI